MTDSTSAEVEIAASAAKVMGVIADVAAYPQWTAFKKAQVLESHPDERPALVEFAFDMGAFKDEQVMSYTWQGNSLASWQMVKSNLIESLAGSYQLSESEGKTRVVYELTMRLNMPLISAMRRRAEKMIIDSALQGLKKRVESLK
jgi:ribosome-associated toxin RatA of RatAB toxin-antitoxin module